MKIYREYIGVTEESKELTEEANYVDIEATEDKISGLGEKEEEVRYKKETSVLERLESYLTGVKPGVTDLETLIKQKINKSALRSLDLIEQVLDSIDEPIEKENIVTELKIELDKLWSYRKCREEEFARLLNLIQITLKYVVAEQLIIKDIEILKTVVCNLCKSTITSDDLKECKKQLRKTTFDIYEPFYRFEGKEIIIRDKKDEK